MRKNQETNRTFPTFRGLACLVLPLFFAGSCISLKKQPNINWTDEVYYDGCTLCLLSIYERDWRCTRAFCENVEEEGI